jgi:hypothetical protein
MKEPSVSGTTPAATATATAPTAAAAAAVSHQQLVQQQHNTSGASMNARCIISLHSQPVY